MVAARDNVAAQSTAALLTSKAQMKKHKSGQGMLMSNTTLAGAASIKTQAGRSGDPTLS